MPNYQIRLRRPARPAGRREKNNDRIRVRNRRYKIKRYLAQPKNIDVRHNGRVVRRLARILNVYFKNMFIQNIK